jgi:TPR repeat protein
VAADPGPSVADTAIDSDFYVQRGNDMLDLGDVASARLFYQAGAKAGAINCLTAIGLTYDPLALEQRGLTAIYADSKLAIQWYEKAIQAGDQQASERLSKLRTWLADVAAITAPAAPSRY